jgi:hypothetical protein
MNISDSSCTLLGCRQHSHLDVIFAYRLQLKKAFETFKFASNMAIGLRLSEHLRLNSDFSLCTAVTRIDSLNTWPQLRLLLLLSSNRPLHQHLFGINDLQKGLN